MFINMMKKTFIMSYLCSLHKIFWNQWFTIISDFLFHNLHPNPKRHCFFVMYLIKFVDILYLHMFKKLIMDSYFWKWGRLVPYYTLISACRYSSIQMPIICYDTWNNFIHYNNCEQLTAHYAGGLIVLTWPPRISLLSNDYQTHFLLRDRQIMFINGQVNFFSFLKIFVK